MRCVQVEQLILEGYEVAEIKDKNGLLAVDFSRKHSSRQLVEIIRLQKPIQVHFRLTATRYSPINHILRPRPVGVDHQASETYTGISFTLQPRISHPSIIHLGHAQLV